MRWVIGICLVWMVVSSSINLMSPAYDNILNTVFHLFWLLVAVVALGGLFLNWGI